MNRIGFMMKHNTKTIDLGDDIVTYCTVCGAGDSELTVVVECSGRPTDFNCSGGNDDCMEIPF